MSTGDRLMRDGIREAAQTVADVHDHDPAETWARLSTLPRDVLQAAVVALACQLDPAATTTGGMTARCEDVSRAVGRPPVAPSAVDVQLRLAGHTPDDVRYWNGRYQLGSRSVEARTAHAVLQAATKAAARDPRRGLRAVS